MAGDEGGFEILDFRSCARGDRRDFFETAMKTVILGLGKSGRAAYDLLKHEGCEVVGFDDAYRGEALDLTEFERVVVSPGVPLSHPLVQEARRLGVQVVGEAGLALSRMRETKVAVTGTNGKTTVCLLIGHVLKRAGVKMAVLGNIGNPLSEYVRQGGGAEVAVVELSSYQLETLEGKLFELGLILNITPDHLERHGSMETYADAKWRLSACIKKGGELWVHESIARKGVQTYGKNRSCTLWTDRVALLQCSAVELILPTRYRDLGVHESENVLAAWIVCRRLGVAKEVFVEAVETFVRPAHRIEKVAVVDGVEYVDDSKGTNLDATVKAVESMQKPVVLIAGGVDKGASYAAWKKPFEGRVRCVVALGAAAETIARDLAPEYAVEIFSSLEEAVRGARGKACVGDVVLLSPGGSSFDLFRDYAHRGEEFKKIVKEMTR